MISDGAAEAIKEDDAMSVFFMDFDMAPSVIWARDLYDQIAGILRKRFGLLWKRTGRTGKPPARMSLLDMCGTRKVGSGGRLTRRQHPA